MAFVQHGNFFFTQTEGLRTEDVAHCTNCKFHLVDMIAILGYIGKIPLVSFAWAVT